MPTSSPVRGLLVLPLVALGAFAPRPACADPLFGPSRDQVTTEDGKPESASGGLRPGFGMRVGGYGFRNETSSKWDDCRMNGVGVFGTLDLSRHFFGELSVDLYGAAPDVRAEGLDRVSTHLLAGGGARMAPDFVVSPFVQLGGGSEWTRVSTDAGAKRTATRPVGYLGAGLELNITRRLAFGAAIRMLLTARVQDEAKPVTTGAVASRPGGEKAPELSTDLASQGLFSLRYAL